MFARTALLAVLIAHVIASELADFRQYTTVLHKGMTGVQITDKKGPFFIREGQCSGLLDNLLRCPIVFAPKSVYVSVEDVLGFAQVIIGDDMRSARVVRTPPCRGEALVQLQLACMP